MRTKMKMAAAALGLMLASAVGSASSAVEPGYYADDDYGNCRAGQFSVNDQDWYYWAVYRFPALRNGESVGVQGSLYNSNGPVWGYEWAGFTCYDGFIYYDGWFQNGPSWE